MTSALLKIGEIAAQAGVSTRAVDYYTTLGLIAPVGRTDGGFRLYSLGAADRITAIRHLESLGVSLDTIAAALTAAEPVDLAALINRLDQDLHTLQAATATAGADGCELLLTAVTRAHHLITTALDLAATLPPAL